MPYSYKEGRYIHEFPKLPNFTVERNLMTFATSRTGKGACQIIPFLLQSNDRNCLVIDPKGEALETTYQHRRAMGHKVAALDPFKTARIADQDRARMNFLDNIDPENPNAFRQINALCDGLVMRHDPKGGHWDDGALEVLAGFVAHVLSAPEFEERRSLITVRELLKTTGEAFGAIVDAMAENHACGSLPAVAATKLLNTGSEAGHFLSGAASNTKWLDDPHMKECLSESTFRMGELKTSPLDIFLVLPMDTLGDYGRFLRLFTRMALYHMQQKLPSGELKGRETYFILDEAFSVGNIKEIQTAMGGMPGFNLHLWPFFQDYNQLFDLYGQAGAGTFFANADASYFFGVNDGDTANLVSRGAGLISEHELNVKPPAKPVVDTSGGSFWDIVFNRQTYEQELYHAAHRAPPNPNQFLGDWEADKHARKVGEWQALQQNKEAEFQDAMNAYAHARSCVGHPRVAPEQVAQITKRNEHRKIADNALVLREGVCYIHPLTAYFERPMPQTLITDNTARPNAPSYAMLYMNVTNEVRQELELKGWTEGKDSVWRHPTIKETIDRARQNKIVQKRADKLALSRGIELPDRSMSLSDFI